MGTQQQMASIRSPPPSKVVVDDFLSSISPQSSPAKPDRETDSKAIVAQHFSFENEDPNPATIFGGADRFPIGAPYRFAGLPFRSSGEPQVEQAREKKRNPRVYTFSIGSTPRCSGHSAQMR